MKIKLLLFIFSLLVLTGCQIDFFGQEADSCATNQYLFEDSFDGAKDCGWAIYERSVSDVRIAEGSLRVTSNEPGRIWWTNPGKEFDNAIISVDTRQLSGPNDNAYGVICRYQTAENFYIFLISGDGYYVIGKYVSGEEQIIYLTGDGQYQYSDVINQGNVLNEIRVSCVGRELSLTVNGILLETVEDLTFVSGDIGLAASPLQPGSSVIQFDNVRVLAP